jgi:GDPmannose 4,6-dehydratase
METSKEKVADRVALITGVTGQDGSYLAEHLLSLGYKVYGMIRRTATDNQVNVRHLKDEPNFRLVTGDMTDAYSLHSILASVKPDEVYNLAAQSFVGDSWKIPAQTQDITGTGALRLFEAVRKECPSARVYQAGSSEMFGKVRETPQRETTPFHPRSPYAVAKTTAHYYAVNYRESYGLHISNGILFNHESPRRGMEFVTQVVADGVAKIYCGLQDYFEIGTFAARRDWGYAGDYVKAMQLMLQQEKPDDYVIGTGVTHDIHYLIDTAFKAVGISQWGGYTRQVPERMRPAEVDLLLADPSKAKEKLGWQAQVSFEALVRSMVRHRIIVHGGEVPLHEVSNAALAG